jgi:8-amino-7-oxononanoate synthase
LRVRKTLKAEAARGEPAVVDPPAKAAEASPGSRTSPFASHPGYLLLKKRFEEVQRRKIAIPYFQPHDGVNGNVVSWAGREAVNFSGYNYLGLSGHPEINRAAIAAIEQYGTSASASRIVSGQIPLHSDLERCIAEFLGVEDSLVFVSGYGTNVTTIGHLFGHKDLVVHDALAHNSIITGCRLSEARRMSFAHNDWYELDALLGKYRHEAKRTLVAIEAVYSMDGDIAELPRAIATKRHHDAMLMVDEAHSIGTLGTTGRGISEYFGVDPHDVDIWMGTLSKSLASCGGYIAGDRELIEYMRYSAPGFLFSVGLSPPDTAAALAALQILDREPGRVEQLRQRARYFRECLDRQGLPVNLQDETPIVPVVIGDSHDCMRLSQRLYASGFHVQPIIYPAVPADGARLRFFITIDHTEKQIERAVQALSRELERLRDPDA